MVIFACIYVLRTNTIDTVHFVRYDLARTPVVIIIIFPFDRRGINTMYVRAHTLSHACIVSATNSLRPQLVNQNDALTIRTQI